MKPMKTILSAGFMTAVLLSSCYNFSFFPSASKYYKTLFLADEVEDFTPVDTCADNDGTLYMAGEYRVFTWSESSEFLSLVNFETPIKGMDIDTETSQLYVLTDSLWEVDLSDSTETLMKEYYENCSALCIAGDYIAIGLASDWDTSSCWVVRRSDYAITDSFDLPDRPDGLVFSASDSRLFIEMADQCCIVDLDQATGSFGTVNTVDTGANIRAISPNGTIMVTDDGSIVSADENWDYLGTVNDGYFSYNYNLSAASFFGGFLIVFVNDSGSDSERQGITVHSLEVPFDPIKPTMGIESVGMDLLVSGDFLYLIARPGYDYSQTEIYRFDGTVCDP